MARKQKKRKRRSRSKYYSIVRIDPGELQGKIYTSSKDKDELWKTGLMFEELGIHFVVLVHGFSKPASDTIPKKPYKKVYEFR